MMDYGKQMNEGSEMRTGMAYIPAQNWNEPYDGYTALERGTLFPELDMPFFGKEAGCD